MKRNIDFGSHRVSKTSWTCSRLAFTLVCLRLRERYACIAAVFVPIPGGEIEQACEQAGERTRAPGVSKKKKEKKKLKTPATHAKITTVLHKLG